MAKKPPTRVRFTKTVLEALKAPKSGRLYVYDTQTPGLALCVTAQGTKTFYFYRKVNGRPVRVRLEQFPGLPIETARKLATGLIADVAAGRDPQADRRAKRQEPTLADLFDHWLESHAKPHKKSWAEDEKQYRRYLSGWTKRRLSSIKTADVRALHTRLGRENGKYAANRALALLRAMYNRGAEIGWSGENPTQNIKPFREQSRDRFLQPGELPKFFESLTQEPNPILQGFFLTCLLTAARRRNVECMRWDDIDLQTATWRIPDTKSGEPQVVPLSPPALRVLTDLKSLSRDGWVFPSQRKKHGHLTEPIPAWRRIVARAGLTDLRIHDLRRSLASWQALTGASLQITGESLCHTPPETTAIYSRLDVTSVRQSIDKATDAMLAAGGLLEGPQTTIGEDNGEET